MYIDDFLLASNIMSLLEELKRCFAKKYDLKNLRKVKTIIGWQISRDTVLNIMKIDQLVFIKDLVIKKRLIEYNPNVIPIKVGSAIDISKVGDYEEN